MADLLYKNLFYKKPILKDGFCEKYQIPSSVLINIDRMPLKYPLVSNQTMVQKEYKHATIVHKLQHRKTP